MGSPRTSVTSVTSVTSSTSQHSSGRESSAKHRYDSTKASLAKLARLLTPKEKNTENKNLQQFYSTIPNIEVTPLRRTGSVDSLLDCTSFHVDSSDISNCSSMACIAAANSSSNLSTGSPVTGETLVVPVTDGRTIPTSPSVPAKLEAHRKGGDLPSSPSVPNRLAKGGSGPCLESSDMLFEGLPLSKAERKRLEKVNKINIDLQALFVAVEHEQLERAKSILSTSDVNVNCINNDGFTPLDIAVMILDISMAKLLQSYGARETTRFRTKESRFSQLRNLFRETERCVDELTSFLISSATSGNTLSVTLIKEKEKQLNLWKRRQKLISRMKSGFEKIKPPGPPAYVHLEVVGIKALKVKFAEPETADSPETIVTKYKVEWSMHEDFRFLTGSREMVNLQKLEMVIAEVTHGIPYYFRVSAGNSKGYGPPKVASPSCAVPSSWMDVDGKRSRPLGRLCQLDCIFHKIIFSRPPCCSEIKDMVFSHTLETPQQQRRHVRKSIKYLFTSTPKFQKTMKRGVYLACLLYSNQRVLVTTEDTLPIMEVDDNCPSSLNNDFHWLMKVACTWEDAKALRLEMEKSHSSSTVHFRNKLLQASEMMQNALGIQDLGQFYYKPFRDSNDTTVLCTIKYIPDPKSLTNLSVRWIPLAKLHRKLSINSNTLFDNSTVNSTLLSTTQSMMTYNHVSRTPLPKGLYVAYVKICASVELIRVLVPKKAPNVLPYFRMRENPHVSRTEWEWIKSMANPEKTRQPTETQLKFQKLLSSAIRNLLTLLEIPPEQYGIQRIYDAEVVELNPEVSLILLLPPIDTFCSAPGQKDDVTDRDDCILLPVQVFEMIHMMTYQHTFISKYSRISSILEMDTIVANHLHREAFSSTEVASAKSRLRQLNDFHNQVDNTWRAMRWLMDVLNFAREKQPSHGISLDTFLLPTQESPCGTPDPSPRESPVRHTLQVPCSIPTQRSKINKPADSITIKITNSTSSFSLTETNSSMDNLMVSQINSEMRRCASTSGLMQAAMGVDTKVKNLRPTAINDQPKVRSSSTVTLQIEDMTEEKCDLVTESKQETETAIESGEELATDMHILVPDDLPFDEPSSQESIIINVLGSSASLSSNDPQILEIEEDTVDVGDTTPEPKIPKLAEIDELNYSEEESDEDEEMEEVGQANENEKEEVDEKQVEITGDENVNEKAITNTDDEEIENYEQETQKREDSVDEKQVQIEENCKQTEDNGKNEAVEKEIEEVLVTVEVTGEEEKCTQIDDDDKNEVVEEEVEEVSVTVKVTGEEEICTQIEDDEKNEAVEEEVEEVSVTIEVTGEEEEIMLEDKGKEKFEAMCSNNEIRISDEFSDDSSEDDGGLQFKYIPSVDDEEEEQESVKKDIEFFTGKVEPTLTGSEDETLAEGVLIVHLAYDCSLSPDSVVRLHIEQETCAREIVDAVVEQVNNQCENPEDSENFCLVASLNSEERVLSESFQPLKVQNPWTKGKLFVRKRGDTIEESAVQTAE